MFYLFICSFSLFLKDKLHAGWDFCLFPPLPPSYLCLQHRNSIWHNISGVNNYCMNEYLCGMGSGYGRMGVGSFSKVHCSTGDVGRFWEELGDPGQGGKLLGKSFEKQVFRVISCLCTPGGWHAWRCPSMGHTQMVPTPSERPPGWGQKLRTLG